MSVRLKELVAHEIIEALDDGPGYRLTDKGQDLRLILIEIAKWAHRWRKGDSPRHRDVDDN